MAAAGDASDLVFYADRRGQAAEEKAAWFQHSPHGVEHGAELSVVAREVEHSVADDDVGEGVWKRHFLDVLDAEVA